MITTKEFRLLRSKTKFMAKGVTKCPTNYGIPLSNCTAIPKSNGYYYG